MTGFRLQIGQNTRQTSECERVSSTLKAKALQATAPEAHANTRIHTIDGRGSKASGPRLTALVSCPLASDSLAVAQWRPPQRRPTPPTYPTESACPSGAGVATPTERPPKCGERADATARAWLTQAVPLPSAEPSHDPSVRFSVRHMHHTSLLFVPQAELARAARAWQRPTLCLPAWRERFGRRGACVARS